MTTLSATMNARVIQAYQAKHSFVCPPYPLEQCGFSLAKADLKDIFIFANPPLQPGEIVAMDQLELMPLNKSGLGYYFLDRSTYAPQQPVADASAPVTGKDRGWTPDVPKSPDEVWRAIRDFCR